MKSIGLSLFLSGLLCLSACTPDENNTKPEQASDAAMKTETPGMTETMPDQTPQNNPVVRMVTNKGTILIELYADKAPITVANFLSYVNDGFYNGTIFHRVIPGFMIQGGGMTPTMQEKTTKPPIKNETTNKLRNKRGTIAMARRNPPDSATSQFFINLVDNRSLDFDGPYAPGYAVFGKVTEGMEVVDQIAAVPTRRIGPHGNVPVQPVIIESVTVVK